MATTYSYTTPKWSNSKTPTVTVSVSISANSSNLAVMNVDWSLKFNNSTGSNPGWGNNYCYIQIDGTDVVNGSYSFSRSSTTTLASGTRQVPKEVGKSSIEIYCSIDMTNLIWGGYTCNDVFTDVGYIDISPLPKISNISTSNSKDAFEITWSWESEPISTQLVTKIDTYYKAFNNPGELEAWMANPQAYDLLSSGAISLPVTTRKYSLVSAELKKARALAFYSKITTMNNTVTESPVKTWRSTDSLFIKINGVWVPASSWFKTQDGWKPCAVWCKNNQGQWEQITSGGA